MKAPLCLLVFLAVASRTCGAAPSLPASAHNFTVKLTVTSMQTAATYGETPAAEGRRFLVFDAEWTDVIDPALAQSRGLPDGAKNDNLAESLSLVLDDAQSFPAFVREADTAHLDAEDSEAVGHSGGSTDAAYIRKVVGLKNAGGKRSLAYFDLPQPGAKVRGDLVFDVPAEAAAHALELRYHDLVGGDLAIPLSTSKASSPTTVSDPAGTQTNEVLAISARLAESAGHLENPPPPGRRYVAVQFQARSQLKVQDQFPPYDPSHATSETWWRPDPVGWTEFRDSVQLVAGDALPCGLEKESDAPAEPEFPARSWGRYRLVYLVPEKAKSFDLMCYFPEYTIPGHDGTVTPKPMRFHLAGEPSAPPAAVHPDKIVADGDLELIAAGHHLTTEFAGEKAAEGERFLLVDFVVRNKGKEVGRFIPGDQCVWFSQGQENAPDEISIRGPLAAPVSFAIGPGEVRAFQVAWRVPGAAKKFEMGLKGNVVAEKFTLAAAAP